MYAGCPEALGYAAGALILDGDWPGAQAQLDEALGLAQRIGERLAMPSLLLLQARIALGRNDGDGARAWMRESLREARAQGADGLALEALVALAAPEGREPEDLAALAEAYRRATEGFDTKTYLRAGELLAASA